MSATGYIYPNEMDRVLRMPGGPVGIAIRRYGLDVAAEGKRMMVNELGHNPYDKPRTGKTARSWRVEVEPDALRGFAFRVFNASKIAKILEDGSDEHLIFPRRKRFLRFRDRNGRYRVEAFAWHPGTEPYHFLQRAISIVNRKYA
jgi:hypothetical protein